MDRLWKIVNGIPTLDNPTELQVIILVKDNNIESIFPILEPILGTEFRIGEPGEEDVYNLYKLTDKIVMGILNPDAVKLVPKES